MSFVQNFLFQGFHQYLCPLLKVVHTYHFMLISFADFYEKCDYLIVITATLKEGCAHLYVECGLICSSFTKCAVSFSSSYHSLDPLFLISFPQNHGSIHDFKASPDFQL